MFTLPLSRLATLSLVLLSLIVLGGTKLPGTGAQAIKGDLTVHEWGTFTSVTSRDGNVMEWRPLSFESDLPSFVYSIDKGATWRGEGGGLRYPSKSASFVRVRMETPVLYFYAKSAGDVSVKVDFPGGKITEWYPQASVAGRSIDWGQLRVTPGAQVNLLTDGRENHYYPARETDAATLEVRSGQQTEHEKFLFYRGVGNFGLPLSARLQDDKVVITNADGVDVGKVIIFENRGGKVGFTVRDASQNDAAIDRPTLNINVAPPRPEMKALLVAHGLYEREAEAMLKTWRDSWFEEGLRVFYIVPRKFTDAILPITIEPKPAELVRVLVGRTELITPEIERNVIEQVVKLDDPSESVRQAALKEINKYGRFTEPILKQTLQHATDRKLQVRILQLIDEMRQ